MHDPLNVKYSKLYWYNFNLFFLFTIYILYKYLCAAPKDDPQERSKYVGVLVFSV
jgi:hypothetical protein